MARTILRTIQKVVNQDMDIASLQRKHNARAGRVVRIVFSDARERADLAVLDGRLEIVEPVENPNCTVTMTTEVMLDLIEGRIRIPQQDGTFEYESYALWDAWRRSELAVQTSDPNEGWLSELFLLQDIWKEAFEKLRKRFGF